MNEDHIAVTDGAVSFVGYDAVNLYRAMQLRAALKLYAKTGIISTRGANLKFMLGMACQYTGKSYPVRRPGAMLAAEDMTVWIETMKSALPVEVK